MKAVLLHISLAAAVVLPLPAQTAGSAGSDNQVVMSIEPTPEHPRNSEGAFTTLNSGRVAFYYAQFYGGDYDFSAARIVEIHSDDKGLTWSQPRIVFGRGDNLNVTQVSLLRLASGQLAMFYMVMKNELDFRMHMRLSTDEGASWSEPKCIMATPPGYYEVTHDRAIQTRNGRIIVPMTYHRTINASGGEWVSSIDQHTIGLWYYSDDEGTNWHESPTWWALPCLDDKGNLREHGLEEAGIVELADGSLFSWFRTDLGSEYASRCGPYGGEPGNPLIFTAPEPTELKAPFAPVSIKRLPNSNALLAIYNDRSGRFPITQPDPGDIYSIGGRTPLVAAISTDGGKTWPRRMLIEGDPKSAFCYTAIHFAGDHVFLAYNASDSQLVGHLDRLRIRRISVPWLLRQAR